MNTNRGPAEGFTLIELMVALVLLGLVAGAVFTTLSNNSRVFRAQLATMDMQQQVRATSFIVPGELRELDAAEGDLIAMSPTDITINAMRQLGVICAPPVVAAGTILIDQARWFGFRWFDPDRDSLLIFAENSVQSRADDQWLRARIVSATQTTGACTSPAGQAATLTVSIVGGNAQLGGVGVGSPIRGFELERLALYQDSDGEYYLGQSALTGGVWSSLQPIAGPLQPNGLVFQYFDSAGTLIGSTDAAARQKVRSIEVRVRGQTDEPQYVPGTGQVYFKDSVVTRVWLRNNPRP